MSSCVESQVFRSWFQIRLKTLHLAKPPIPNEATQANGCRSLSTCLLYCDPLMSQQIGRSLLR